MLHGSLNVAKMQRSISGFSDERRSSPNHDFEGPVVAASAPPWRRAVYNHHERSHFDRYVRADTGRRLGKRRRG
jgi:hypothetical protein